MPKVTIYVPDDLAGTLIDRRDINVSAVCQKALREALGLLPKDSRLDALEERLEVLEHWCRDHAYTVHG